jgi:hypothetical protein
MRRAVRGVGNLGQQPRTAAAETVRGVRRRFRRRPTPAARWPLVGRHRPLARRNRPRRCVRPPIHSPGCWTPRRTPPPQHGHCRWPLCGTGRTPDRRCGSCGGHPLSAARPADRSESTGTTTSGHNPSRLRQKGRSGSAQAAVMAPVAGRLTAAGRTRPPAGRRGHTPDRTPEAADGQSADRSGSYNFLYSSLPQGRPRSAATPEAVGALAGPRSSPKN